MSYRKIPVDPGFAKRSARYLARRGLTISEIRSALVEQLDLDRADANHVVRKIAA